MFPIMDAWSIYNQTIASMNDSANSQYYSTISYMNNIQAHSVDPSDMGAYNLTMYGMNAIHGIQSMIVSNLSNLQSMTEQAMNGSAVASPAPPTIVNSPYLSPVASLTNTLGSIAPAHNLFTAVLLVVIGIAVGALIFNR